MADKRETKKDQRHEDIYAEFCRVLAIEREKVGPHNVNLKVIYEIVAENNRCSSVHVYHVINKMLKAGKCRKA